MSDFDQLAGIQPLRIWDGIAARTLHGELVSFAVIELDPGSTVPEHRHENEQLGIVLAGSNHDGEGNHRTRVKLVVFGYAS